VLEIARILLDAGAEADAALAGGESTTLGLVATSAHPRRAGVQIPLLELLLARGAAIDGVTGGWSPLNAALANGRPEAALFLAQRGARLDLEGAAGLGRLDVVAASFGPDGALRNGAAPAQLQAGFRWAAEYGRNDVLTYLLDRGAGPAAQDRNGLTALHWAVVGGHLDTVRLLLARNAPLEIVNVWGGTVLGTAV
jgi:ankyrin repeat protein